MRRYLLIALCVVLIALSFLLITPQRATAAEYLWRCERSDRARAD